MSDSNAPESPQIPTSGGGAIWIVGAALVLAAVGGVVFWMRGGDQQPPPVPKPTVSAEAPAEPLPTSLAESIPPPPPVEEVAPPDAGPAKAQAPGKAVDLCAGPCGGTATAGLTQALSTRAASSRTCYERALRTNETLQGKMVVKVRVDATGKVCSAQVAEDGVGSQEVSSCVLGTFRGVKLPAPTNGCLDVNVPMSFVPRGGK